MRQVFICIARKATKAFQKRMPWEHSVRVSSAMSGEMLSRRTRRAVGEWYWARELWRAMQVPMKEVQERIVEMRKLTDDRIIASDTRTGWRSVCVGVIISRASTGARGGSTVVVAGVGAAAVVAVTDSGLSVSALESEVSMVVLDLTVSADEKHDALSGAFVVVRFEEPDVVVFGILLFFSLLR